jgi:hypothetical protein
LSPTGGSGDAPCLAEQISSIFSSFAASFSGVSACGYFVVGAVYILIGIFEYVMLEAGRKEAITGFQSPSVWHDAPDDYDSSAKKLVKSEGLSIMCKDHGSQLEPIFNDKAREFAKLAAKDPKVSRRLLEKAGIIDRDGNLSKEYAPEKATKKK